MTIFCALHTVHISSSFIWSVTQCHKNPLYHLKFHVQQCPGVCKTTPHYPGIRHLWVCLKIILLHKNCYYAFLCPTNPFKILCTSSQAFIQCRVLLWSCSWGQHCLFSWDSGKINSDSVTTKFQTQYIRTRLKVLGFCRGMTQKNRIFTCTAVETLNPLLSCSMFKILWSLNHHFAVLNNFMEANYLY